MLQEQKDNLEERSNKLFEELVPDEGNCKTIEGEMLRAINRIIYRYYNDGDYFYKGYGCETAGPAHAFLYYHTPNEINDKVHSALVSATLAKSLDEESNQYNDDDMYDHYIHTALDHIVSYIESKNGDYINNSAGLDIWKCTSKFKNYEDEDEDEDYYGSYDDPYYNDEE